MVDRHDLDALLIGALYGELTPADEARLAAHLESHPADRTALDDLKSARTAVRESRIFERQVEPPQAISALLLQEAARRAPRRAAGEAEPERESWFFRFIRSFMAHPAIAAAAMLVVVVGVAGTLYLRQGDMFVEKQASMGPPPAAERSLEEAPAAAAPAATSETAASGAGAGSGYQVGLVDGDQPSQALDEGRADNAQAGGEGLNDKLARQEDAVGAKPAPAKHAGNAVATKKGTSRGYLEVGASEPQPRDLPERSEHKKAKVAAPRPTSKTEAFGGMSDDRAPNDVGLAMAPGNAPTGGAAGTGAGQAEAPRSRAPVVAQAPAAPPPPPAQKAPSERRLEKSSASKADGAKDAAKESDDRLLGWARSEHAAVVALVKAGKCPDAAKRALTVRQRAPEYYAQYVVTDRALKACMTYIAHEAERHSERKAAKPANADEAPAATSK